MLQFIESQFAETLKQAPDPFAVPLPKLLAEQPELSDYERLAWHAYCEMRVEGMSGWGESYIPRSAIRSFLREEWDISDPDEIDEWVGHIRALETEYFESKEKKHETEEAVKEKLKGFNQK